jgi:hypothetical protein
MPLAEMLSEDMRQQTCERWNVFRRPHNVEGGRQPIRDFLRSVRVVAPGCFEKRVEGHGSVLKSSAIGGAEGSPIAIRAASNARFRTGFITRTAVIATQVSRVASPG